MSDSPGQLSTLGLLGVAFVVLTLTHVIAWSWWWVLAPFWIHWILFGVLAVLLAAAQHRR